MGSTVYRRGSGGVLGGSTVTWEGFLVFWDHWDVSEVLKVTEVQINTICLLILIFLFITSDVKHDAECWWCHDQSADWDCQWRSVAPCRPHRKPLHVSSPFYFKLSSSLTQAEVAMAMRTTTTWCCSLMSTCCEDRQTAPRVSSSVRSSCKNTIYNNFFFLN